MQHLIDLKAIVAEFRERLANATADHRSMYDEVHAHGRFVSYADAHIPAVFDALGRAESECDATRAQLDERGALLVEAEARVVAQLRRGDDFARELFALRAQFDRLIAAAADAADEPDETGFIYRLREVLVSIDPARRP